MNVLALFLEIATLSVKTEPHINFTQQPHFENPTTKRVKEEKQALTDKSVTAKHKVARVQDSSRQATKTQCSSVCQDLLGHDRNGENEGKDNQGIQLWTGVMI